MELRKKDSEFDSAIKSSDEFANKYDFIKGYFTDLVSINNNEEFLEYYRYIQYWKLEIPEMMEHYASIPNYSPKSLLANMLLTGDDEYYKKLSSMITNKENKYTSYHIFPPDLDDKPFLCLVKSDRADLTQKLIDDGNTPHDIFSSPNEGNCTLEVIKVMISEGYIPPDEIIIWYISKGMGGIASICITDCSDIDFIFEENPIDMDSYSLIYDPKTEDDKREFEPLEMTVELSERLLYKLLETNSQIDVALFMKLYKSASSVISLSEKYNLLNHVLDRGELMLIQEFMKELDKEGLERDRIENLILYKVKSANGFVIFSLVIQGEKNYDKIFDYCCDIDTEEKSNYYRPTTQEEEDQYISTFCGGSSSEVSQEDCEYSDFESRENSEIPNRYRYNSYTNEPEEIIDEDYTCECLNV